MGKIKFSVTSDSNGWTSYGELANMESGGYRVVMNDDNENYSAFELVDTPENRAKAEQICREETRIAENPPGIQPIRNSFVVSANFLD